MVAVGGGHSGEAGGSGAAPHSIVARHSQRNRFYPPELCQRVSRSHRIAVGTCLVDRRAQVENFLQVSQWVDLSPEQLDTGLGSDWTRGSEADPELLEAGRGTFDEI